MNEMHDKGPIDINKVEKEIERLLQEAKDRAVVFSEIDRMIKRKIEILGLSPAEFRKSLNEYKELDQKILSHTIILQTLPEYRMLLQKTVNPEAARRILAHENAHINVAQSLGANIYGYALTVSKNERGFFYNPYASYGIPASWDSWDTQRKIEAELKIVNAPAEYDSHLSEFDEQRVEGLKNKLNT